MADAALVDPAYAVNGTSEQTPDTAPEPVWPSHDQEYLCACARDHFSLAQEAEGPWRERALDDQRFAHGEQWHAELLRARKDRQCLVIDRAGTPLRQIVNEGRQNRLGIAVSPVGYGATAETARLLKGLVRNIEEQSNADIAYTTARQNAVTQGRGYVRILPVYLDDFSFEQELRIFPIRNIFSVYMDPSHVSPDASDANWCLIVERMSRRVYEQKYRQLPGESAVWASLGDSWVTRDDVMVAEYWWREWHPLDLVQLRNEHGVEEVMPLSRLPKERQGDIVDRRTAHVPQVWYAKLNGYEVLHQSRWQGRYLPIAQFVGECWDIEGEVDYQGLIRRLKDPQRMYNYWESSKAEMIALAPKAPFIGAAQQFEGYQQFWQTANTHPHAYLPYQAVVLGGQMLPPPQRSSVEPPVQAMVQGAQLAADEIKAISGYYDPALGQNSPDTSGVAIGKRQQATNTASYHFVDNERWGIRHVGRILIDAIPFYYGSERTERIIGDDGKGQAVTLNKRERDPKTDQDVITNNVKAGRYDVSVDAGPSFASKRQEAADKLGQLLQAAPDLMRVFGDDYLASLDVEQSEHMAERMRKSMPPALLQGEPGAEKYVAAQAQLQQLEHMPQLQAQLQEQQKTLMQMQAQVESLTQTNNQLNLALINKQREQEIDMQKLRNDAAEKEQAHAADMAKLAIERFKAETARMDATRSPETAG